MKPKLYQYAACPYCNKVSTLLAYKGVDYEVIEVDPMKKKEIAFSEDYKKVPIYIDEEGKQWNESNTIMEQIDLKHPSPKVFSDEPAQKALDQKWLEWSEKYVKGLPTVVYRTLGDSIKAFDYITKVGKFSWFQSRMIKYSGAFIMNLVANKIQKREEIEDPEAFLKQQIQEWVEGLEGKQFMGGSEPSVSDFAVFGISRAVAELKAGEIFKTNAAFQSWFERMLEQTKLSTMLVSAS